SRRRHTRSKRDWSSDVSSSDLQLLRMLLNLLPEPFGINLIARAVSDLAFSLPYDRIDVHGVPQPIRRDLRKNRPGFRLQGSELRSEERRVGEGWRRRSVEEW